MYDIFGAGMEGGIVLQDQVKRKPDAIARARALVEGAWTYACVADERGHIVYRCSDLPIPIELDDDVIHVKRDRAYLSMTRGPTWTRWPWTTEEMQATRDRFARAGWRTRRALSVREVKALMADAFARDDAEVPF